MKRSSADGAALPILATLMMVHVWRVQDLFPILGSLQLPILSMLAGILLFFRDGVAARVRPAARNPIVKWVGVLYVMVVIGVPFSLYKGLSFSFASKEFSQTLFVFLLLGAGIRSFRVVERLMLVFLSGALLYAGLMLTRFEVGESGRLDELVYYDANDLGMLMVMSLPIAVYFIRPGTKIPIYQRVMVLLGIGLIATALAKTGSRGAFLGLICVAAYMVFRFTAVKATTRLVSVLGAFVVLGAVGGQTYWTMMGTILNPSEDYNVQSESGRMEIWKRGMGYMAARPLVGVGARCFGMAEGTLGPLAERQAMGFGVKWSAPHNSFVEVGAEIGVIGLIAFLMMLMSARSAMAQIIRVRVGDPNELPSHRALAQSLTAALLGYAVCAFFLTQAFGPVLYILLGLMLAFWRVTVRPRPRNGSSRGRSRPVMTNIPPFAAPV